MADPPLNPAGLDLLMASVEGREEVVSAAIDLIGQITHPVSEEGRAWSFGRFLVRRVLGQGRFGVVLLAEDPGVPRRVALKLPQPGVLLDPEQLARFCRDAEAAGELDHPGIVPILEAGAVGPVPYLASAFVDGPTLSTWVKAAPAPAPPREPAALVAELARAVQHAHDRGVLHCDLKPSNVLLEPTGGDPSALASYRPRVTDFNLARLLRPDAPPTRTLQVAGTLPYMAPEQALGRRRDLTARCDVYALGAILYELLAGRPPFADEDEAALLRRLLEEEPPRLRGLRPGLPRDLEAIALRCLEKEPSRRYVSAQALADDLGRFLDGRPTMARPVGLASRVWRWARRRPMLAALFTMLAAALAGVFVLAGYLVHSRGDLAAARTLGEMREFHAIFARVRERRVERPEGWSDANLADLRKIAVFPSAGEHLADLRTEAAAALAAVELRPVAVLQEGLHISEVAFSPDGKTVALAEQWPVKPALRVQLRDADGGRLLREMSYPVDLDWERRHKGQWADGPGAMTFSPDGRYLVVGTKSGWLNCWDLRVPGAAPARWRAHPRQEGEHGIEGVVFSEDGTVLASSTISTVRRWRASTWEAFGGPAEARLPKDRTPLPSVVSVLGPENRPCVLDLYRENGWGPPHKAGASEKRLFARSKAGMGVSITSEPLWLARLADGERLLPLAPPRYERDPQANYLAFSPGGDFLVESSSNSLWRVRLWDVCSGRLLQVREGVPGRRHVAFRSDGRRVILSEETTTRLYELTQRDVQRTIALRPTSAQAFAVTPDGDSLLVHHRGQEAYAATTLYDRRADGDYGQRWVSFWPHSHKGQVAVRADGRAHAFTAGTPSPLQRIMLSGEERLEVHHLYDMRFAPSGQFWTAAHDEITAWSIPAGKEVGRFRGEPNGDRRGFHFTSVWPARRLTAAGREDGVVMLFDQRCRTVARWQAFKKAPEQMVRVALSDDESLMLAGSGFGDVRLFRVPSGEVAIDLAKAHRAEVTGVAFGPGGTLVTASRNGTVKLWSPEGELLLTLRERGPIMRLAVSGGGAELTLLVEEELGLRRWDLGRLHAELTALGLDPGFERPAVLPREDTPRRGLQAEVYFGQGHNVLRHVRIDPNIDFDWGLGRPCLEVATDDWSIRWTGYLRPPAAGRYRFRAEIDDEVRLWLDGRLLFERLNGQGDCWREAEVDLPDRPVSLRLDFGECIHTAWCRLLWKRADDPGPFRVVPPEVLFPTREDAFAAEKRSLSPRTQ